MTCNASYNQTHILPLAKDIACDKEEGHKGSHNWLEKVAVAPGGFRWGLKR